MKSINHLSKITFYLFCIACLFGCASKKEGQSKYLVSFEESIKTNLLINRFIYSIEQIEMDSRLDSTSSRKDVVSYFLDVSKDTITQKLKDRKEVLLVMVQYECFDNFPKVNLSIKGNERFNFYAEDEEEEKRQKEEYVMVFETQENRFFSNYQRAGDLEIEGIIYPQVSFFTRRMYREEGIITIKIAAYLTYAEQKKLF
ncbi:hypothetical protein WAF17_17885 [Bernardetia sp. ABR2-2B]|uniref:hypothetical protein n=1 Tax=Bernardetia sp. ABR2-2B TaxID=3127472 RepID=UPI0030D43C97